MTEIEICSSIFCGLQRFCILRLFHYYSPLSIGNNCFIDFILLSFEASFACWRPDNFAFVDCYINSLLILHYHALSFVVEDRFIVDSLFKVRQLGLRPFRLTPTAATPFNRHPFMLESNWDNTSAHCS